MNKEDKFRAALNAIKRFKLFIFKFSFFIASCIVFYDVLSIAQGVDFEENKKASEIALDIFQSMSEKALYAIAIIVVGVIAALFDMVSLFGLNDLVVAISLILVFFALVVDLMLNAPSQQNDLPAQCGTFAHRFYLTKIAIAIFLGEVVIKIEFYLRKTNSNPNQQP